MVVFQDPPIVVDGMDQTARLVDATVAIGPDEIVDLARDATVVLAGPIEVAAEVARQVPDLGPAVVVEVEVVRGRPIDPAPFDDLAAMGIAVGANLVAFDAEIRPDPTDRRAAGWEIGAVTWLLANGVRTIRGVHARRLRRLVAVDAALDAALEVER